MTKEQINRLAKLITDTAETAANIELKALAGTQPDSELAVMASGLKSNCTSCLVLVNGLMQEEASHGRV